MTIEEVDELKAVGSMLKVSVRELNRGLGNQDVLVGEEHTYSDRTSALFDIGK